MNGPVDVQNDSAIPEERPRPARRADHDLWLDPRARAVADLPRQGAELLMHIRRGAVPLEEQEVVAGAPQAVEQPRRAIVRRGVERDVRDAIAGLGPGNA
jgi:hypothetical protein